MRNLDEYLNSPDELFNTNALHWHNQFSNNKQPNTNKPFEVFLKALHEVYFFIQDNRNKPFGCIDKIEEVSESCGFNAKEKLILIDKTLAVLFRQREVSEKSGFDAVDKPILIDFVAFFHHPKQDEKVFIHLINYRNNLSPYNDFDINSIKNEKHKYLKNLDLDYLAMAYKFEELERQYSMGFAQWIKTGLSRSECWHFDIDSIKEKFQSIKTPNEKRKYLKNLDLDYLAMAYKFEELERQYYESIRFVQWIKTELSRSECWHFDIDSIKDKLKAELGKYGFFELPKVKQLSEPNKEKLVELISSKPMPYGIAMFDNLGFCEYLDREQGSKYKTDQILSRLYNEGAKDGTSAKHYRRSLIKPTPRYNAREYKEIVITDYEQLK